jgi:serine/threonine-protein kinase HipA
VSLGVHWGGSEVGRLERAGERSREYSFAYLDRSRPISLSLPVRPEPFTPAESRPFFEGLLPEGVLREQIAGQLRLATGDSYGLLAELGRDCAGALQISAERPSEAAPSVHWLERGQLDRLIAELPHRPLGMSAGEPRMRLSLAGIQSKAVLVGDDAGRFGEPLDGMPSTHILKPQAPGTTEYPELAVNEHFCMRLAGRCGIAVADTQLIQTAGTICLVVKRFDRDRSNDPARRLHQEDGCQALALTPDFKYQRPDWRLPSYAALAQLLDEHSLQPGLDRLALARAAVFNFLIGNADAHARNLSLLHLRGGVHLAPLYDLVCTAAYPALSAELSLAIGDELDPDAIGLQHWLDLSYDLRLRPTAFQRLRTQLASDLPAQAASLAEEAHSEQWRGPVIDTVLATIQARAGQLTA